MNTTVEANAIDFLKHLELNAFVICKHNPCGQKSFCVGTKSKCSGKTEICGITSIPDITLLCIHSWFKTFLVKMKN